MKLALWCEAHGLWAERFKHLTLATLSDPANTMARGLLGLVLYHGKWLRPDAVSRQAQDDPARQAILKEYLKHGHARPTSPTIAGGSPSGAMSTDSRSRL